ncbi:MAG: radical SAM family heme chaperone HemW [Rickettsiales bacterium]|jgi:oxygen-independent coproporphyrinogen-3 oxidase|nr:radical SAM family heme chaperone HemW [Rickettsiales bacterium]
MFRDLSLYIHYPFCLSKCPYCDFNSYRIANVDLDEFLKAYLEEIEYYSNILPGRTVNTIFFGGGTPSLMPVNFLEAIMEKIYSRFRVDKDAEISLEANPTSCEINKFREFRLMGINRLSIGVQSLEEKRLKFLGRIHSSSDVLRAIEIARLCFSGSYSIDLIYAVPGQKIEEWLMELKTALELSPGHMSLYQLTIEPGTEFSRKNIETADEYTAAEMYKVTNEFLESRGMYLYEVSNYAASGYRCRHNLNYWNSGEWLGIGAGAHSRLCFQDEFVNGYRPRISVENIKNFTKWWENTMKFGRGCRILKNLSREESIEEMLLMGLRLRDGVLVDNVKKYIELHSGSIVDILNDNYRILAEKKYIEVSGDNVRIPLEHFCILESIVERII